jgi:translation initiation factor IF-3
MAKIPYSNHIRNKKDQPSTMALEQTLANERIRSPQVRLILQDGSNLGVVATHDALNRARLEGMDLVAINTEAQPMIAKIVDLNKYLYEQKKAAKERARKNRENEIHIKEVQLRPVTDEHDIEIKARNARSFLDDSCKVKVVIKFRGREMAYRELGVEVMNRFLAAVGEHKLEREPNMQGNSIQALLMPVVK